MPHRQTQTFDAGSPAAVRAYADDGVVCLRGAFAPCWLDLAAAGIARNLAHPGPFFRDHTAPGSPGRYVFDFWTWPAIPEFREFAFASPAGRIAATLLDSERAVLLMDNWFLREAGATSGAPWHHDEPYFDFEGRMAILWLPLEPVPRAEGLTFVAGSHRWGKLFMAEQFSANVPFECSGDGYEPIPEIDAERHDLLSWDLEPGDCLVFDFRTLHAATPDEQAPRRTGRRLTLRFGDGATRFRPRGPWTAEISEHLIAQGQQPDAVLDNPLTPVVWPTAAPRP